MRPRLKSDTFFIPMDNGVYLRNNEKSFALKGKTLATWLERLAPALDGRYTLDQLCQAVPVEKRARLTELISLLTEHGYIKDIASDQPHTLPLAYLDLYAPAITFIDYHVDSGAFRFQQFLSLPVLAISSGDSLLALAHTLLETGNRAISLLDTGEEVTNYERLQEILDTMRARDQELTLKSIGAQVWQDEHQLLDLCASAAMVLYFSTGRSLGHAHQLTRLCQQVQVPFLPAVLLENELHLGPLQLPNREGCWQCYWRRWQAAHGLPAYPANDLPVSQAQQEEVLILGKPAIGIVANILALEFFKYGSGVQQDTLEKKVYVLELERLQNTRHTLFPHPLCTVCSSPSSHSDQTDKGRLRMTQDEIAYLKECKAPPQTHGVLIETDQWADANSGLFTQIQELDYVQLPLVRSQISIPLSTGRGCKIQVVQAAGLDYDEVRLAATRRAVASYLESLADERRVCRSTFQELQAGAEVLLPAQLFGWQAKEPVEAASLAWSWAIRLADALPVLVPAAAIAPRSSWNYSNDLPLFQEALPATGLGTAWQEALADGMCKLGTAIIQAQESNILQKTALPVAREAYDGDRLCITYLNMLDILNGQVLLAVCSNTLGLPCIATYLNGELLGISSHWHTVSAVREALKSAVLTLQIRRTPGPGDTIAECRGTNDLESDIAPPSPHSPLFELPPSLADEIDYVRASTTLHTRFKQRGWDVVVAPLVRDQTVSRILPCALRVLAVRQRCEEKA